MEFNSQIVATIQSYEFISVVMKHFKNISDFGYYLLGGNRDTITAYWYD
jgi:hypothetical protein